MSDGSSRIKTPRDAKGIQALKILERTLNSVNQSRIPVKGAANAKHCHFLNAYRDVKRIDRQDWEARIGEMQKLYERHRHQRVNALHNALDRVKVLLQKSKAREKELEKLTGDLERTSGYLQTLMDSMSDMLIATDTMGKVTEVNQAAVRMSGREKPELMGASYATLFRQPELAHEVLRRTLQEKELFDLELELQGPAGLVIPLLLNTSVLVDESAVVFGLLFSARDISELKKAREAQERYAEELARANTDLEEFATVASHDLQEPLKNVAKYALGLSERFRDQFDEKALKEITFMVDQTAYMRELIKNVLDYARVDTEEESLEDVNCESLLEQVKRNLAEAIETAEIRFTHDTLPILPGNGPQLIRVFENLIGNAVKYRDDQKDVCLVHVGIKHLEKSRFKDIVSQPAWLFSFEDNGLGIEPEFLEDVFKMFVRLHPDRAGSGMGLAIVEKIVRRHMGRIWVESIAEEGSIFYLVLPK